MSRQARSPTRALLLALFCPGLGHFYAGRAGLGLLFFLFLNPFSATYGCLRVIPILEVWIRSEILIPAILLFVAAAWVSQALDAWQMVSKPPAPRKK